METRPPASGAGSASREWSDVGALWIPEVRDSCVPPRLGRDDGDRGDRLALIRVHGEHGERDSLGSGTAAFVAEREDKEVESVVEPGVENGMGRLARELPAKAAELARALQRHEEARVRAGKIIGDAELGRDLLVHVGRTGRQGIASAAARQLLDNWGFAHVSRS